MPRIISNNIIVGAFQLILLHLKLKIHGVQYGKSLRGKKCDIINKGKIKIGNNALIDYNAEGHNYKTGLYSYFKNSNITIGNNSRLSGAVIFCREKIDIGDNCRLAPGVIVMDNNSHVVSTDVNVRGGEEVAEAPVIIGNNVWIGMRSRTCYL